MNMLHYQEYHQHIAALIQAALAGADPYAAVKRALQVDGRFLHSGRQSYDLENGRVFVVSVGKAAASMAQAAMDVLETAVTAGVVITKYGSLPEKIFATETLQFFAAAHPISDRASVEATAAVITMLAQTTETDLVLCLISGGASALLTQPLVSLLDWQQLNHALLASGCTINEFNTVRRQLDRVKGGGLVNSAAPAACVSLILSDVVGNPLAVIGSGPTVLLAESPADAILILARYDVAASWIRPFTTMSSPL